MSFALNQSSQISLSDRYANLTAREKKMIEESWAKPFSEIIFPSIREDKFAFLYSDNTASRPNTPINVIVGSLMLKEMLGLSDEDMVTGLVFDIRLQYALHTTSFDEQPLSDRTFSRFREKLYVYELITGVDLLKEEMLYLADKIAAFMELEPYMKRMDSFMIASACKDMTRLEVIYVTTANLAKAIHKSCGDELLSGMENYIKADDKNRVVYHNKAEDKAAKIQSIIEDCTKLVNFLGEAGAELPEYVLAKRMLADQSTTDELGDPTAKSNHDIKPDSLQNPSDPDATYRKKSGENYIGYVANVVETYNTEGASVITDYSYAENRHSDSEFCKETILNISGKGEATAEKKVVIVGDGAYAGAENSELAQENNIILVTTALAGPKPPEVFADFDIDSEAKLVNRCPADNKPLRQSYNSITGIYRTVMEKSQCVNCPHRAECKAKMQAKSAVVNVSTNKVERARTIKNKAISEKEYVCLRNARNAIEGIPSVMRRCYSVDEIPVFGWLRSKLIFGLKIGALNIKKLVKFTKVMSASLSPKTCPQVYSAQM